MYNPVLKQGFRILFLAIIISLISFSFAWAITIHVPEDYPTIQQAIDAAVNGDIVLVNDGTYEESIDFLGKAIIVTSVNGPQATKIISESNEITVTFQNNEGPDSILDRFTITREAFYGGLADGIYCFSSSPTIQNNIIIGNNEGIYVTDYSFPTIKNNIICGNEDRGIFSHNYSNPLIQENIITGNVWAGVYARDSATATIQNNTIIGNGMHGIESGWVSMPMTVENNIIAYNTQYGVGHDLPGPGPQPVLSYNDVWGNGLGGYQAPFVAGLTDISVNPLFEGITLNVPGDYPTITQALYKITEFYLGEGSLCIGAGSTGQNMGAYPEQLTYLPTGDREIHVAEGTYTEAPLYLTPLTKLIGSGAATTILEGQGIAYGIRSLGGLDQNTIEGFTIRNGQLGIYASFSSPLIQSNIITNNEEHGINCHYSACTIYNNTIEENTGEGIHAFSNFPILGLCNPTIENNIIKSNHYGIRCFTTGATIRDNIIIDNLYEGITCFEVSSNTTTIENNTITGNGTDGIQCSSTSPTIQNNTILGNERHGIYLGAYSSICNGLTQNNLIIGNGENGIRCNGNSSPLLLNNTITGNGTNGIYSLAISSPTIKNNIISSNENYGVYGIDNSQPLLSYNDIWDNSSGNYGGTASIGIGDISLDPLFINPEVDHYSLSANSPCIDTGNPEILDPDGTISNMGAFGGPEAEIVNITLFTEQTTVSPGELLTYNSLLSNNFSNTPTVSVRSNVILPDGRVHPGSLGLITLTLNPYETFQRQLNENIPNNAPLGDYIYIGEAGTHEGGIIDESSFNFEVSNTSSF